jgi:hypothetical protein
MPANKISVAQSEKQTGLFLCVGAQRKRGRMRKNDAPEELNAGGGKLTGGSARSGILLRIRVGHDLPMEDGGCA